MKRLSQSMNRVRERLQTADRILAVTGADTPRTGESADSTTRATPRMGCRLS